MCVGTTHTCVYVLYVGDVLYVYAYVACSAVHKLQSFSQMSGLKIVIVTCVVWQHKREHDRQHTDGASCCLQGEEGDTVFEYLVREDNAEWQHWRECVPSWKYPKEQERPKFAQLVIPTLDSVRYEKLLTLAYSVQKVHTLFSVKSGIIMQECAALQVLKLFVCS